MHSYKLFWGDSHANLHSRHIGQLDRTLAHARQTLDFLPMAYYPFEKQDVGGFTVEDYRTDEQIAGDWAAVCKFAAENNRPGELVIFPGYEWQGDVTSGDHNVFFLKDDPPLIRCDKLGQLYEQIRARDLEAYVIPHHTAYRVGVRGKDWSVHDEALSPFAEIFSWHGCSESDEEWIGLRRNRHMGPGVSGGTIEDGLAGGRRFGIICSNDSHGGLAGVWGAGLMACYAADLTRQALWEAFGRRRVYGVTGDRIILGFAVEDAMMGQDIQHKGAVRTLTQVTGCDALDRIELLRNNRVVATHCHNGAWAPPTADERIRCKLRVEVGWGGRSDLLPMFKPRDWDCRIDVPEGVIVAAEKCFRGTGNRVGEVGRSTCEFGFHTAVQPPGGDHINTEAVIFEIEARPGDEIRLRIEGKDLTMTVGEAMGASRIVGFMDEAAEYVRTQHNVDPASLPRVDRLYYTGHKVKVHRAIPQAGFAAEMDWTDRNPPVGVNHYRVRVTQRNGQVAWSSPIWVAN